MHVTWPYINDDDWTLWMDWCRLSCQWSNVWLNVCLSVWMWMCIGWIWHYSLSSVSVVVSGVIGVVVVVVVVAAIGAEHRQIALSDRAGEWINWSDVKLILIILNALPFYANEMHAHEDWSDCSRNDHHTSIAFIWIFTHVWACADRETDERYHCYHRFQHKGVMGTKLSPFVYSSNSVSKRAVERASERASEPTSGGVIDGIMCVAFCSLRSVS